MVIANLPGEVWCLQNLQEVVLSPSTSLKVLVPCEGMRRGTGQGEISAEGPSETWWDLCHSRAWKLCLNVPETPGSISFPKRRKVVSFACWTLMMEMWF